MGCLSPPCVRACVCARLAIASLSPHVRPFLGDAWSALQRHQQRGLGPQPGRTDCSRTLRGSERNTPSVQRRSGGGIIRLTDSETGSGGVGEERGGGAAGVS